MTTLVPASLLEGEVAIANGGTGASTLTAHGVLLGNGTGAIAATSAGTAGQVLTSGGASANPAWGNPGQPYFSVGLAAAQSISSGAFTKVAYDTVAFDPSSYWDATNHRWVPKVAGKYLVVLSLTATAATLSGADGFIAAIYKNGTAVKRVTDPTVAGSSITHGLCVSGIVTMNGSTDYIEGFGYFGPGSTISFAAGITVNSLEAHYIGP